MSSTPALPHFQKLRQLLRQEKEADHRAFLELVREKPLSERVEQGYTWYPLQVLNTGFALSEKAFPPRVVFPLTYPEIPNLTPRLCLLTKRPCAQDSSLCK